MAHGKLGSVNLSASTSTNVYTASKNCVIADVSIHISNNNSTKAVVSIAVGTNSTPNAKDYIEHDLEISPKGIYRLEKLIMSPSEIITVKSDLANVVVRVTGSEKTKL